MPIFVDPSIACEIMEGDLPGPSTGAAEIIPFTNAINSSSDDSEYESDEQIQVSDSDSSASGNSESCPICLLKFKGQAIGFPELCGHPFCLDCILEWSKNVTTCPIDRKQFQKILVRLELDGEIVRKIPINQPKLGEEDAAVLDITECRVCHSGANEDRLLLCDRCDCGYHLYCLRPPLEDVPIEDWFCPSCQNSQEFQQQVIERNTRRRIPLTLRVRRTVQRNRQRVLQGSNIVRKPKRKLKTRRKKAQSQKYNSTKKHRVRSSSKRKKVTVKRRRKKTDVPTPRKRLADALGLSDKNQPNSEPMCRLTLFGNRNELEDPIFEEDIHEEPTVYKPSLVVQSKSLIAQLAERRKTSKSIYNFGPLAMNARKSIIPKKEICSSSSSNILDSILSSQSQLASFGKTSQKSTHALQQKNSGQVLGAILVSRAALDQLDREFGSENSQYQLKVKAQGIKDLFPSTVRTSAFPSKLCLPSHKSRVRITKYLDCTGQSKTIEDKNWKEKSSSHQFQYHGVSHAVCISRPTFKRCSNGEEEPRNRCTDNNNDNKKQNVNLNPNQTESVNSGISAGKGLSGSGGDGEDPSRKGNAKQEPDDVKDMENASEDDVDLYSDIESIDEDLTELPITQLASTVEDKIEEDDKAIDEDDEKGLVIDDSLTEEEIKAPITSTNNLEEISGCGIDGAANDVKESYGHIVQHKTEEVVDLDQIPLPPSVVTTPQRFQHGGLPAAAAALSLGPKGGALTRPQPRLRRQGTPPAIITDAIKANLVSSIASVLKETLTSALITHCNDRSEIKNNTREEIPLSIQEPESFRQLHSAVVKISSQNEDVKCNVGNDENVTNNEDRRICKKKKMAEIFGSDDENVAADEKKSLDGRLGDLEQVSDCEEGELDESEAERERPKIEDEITTSSRRVLMLTPPRSGIDWEEGEIVEKKKKKERKKKFTTEPEGGNAAHEEDILEKAGIGGERKVELSLDDNNISTTFKKLSDSNKARHYRHQPEPKKVNTDKDDGAVENEGKRSKREELKRYDVRKVIEQRSRERKSRSKSRGRKKKSRSRSPLRMKERSRSRSVSRKKDKGGSKSQRKCESKIKGSHHKRAKSSTPSLSPSPGRDNEKKKDREKLKGKENKEKKKRSRSRTRSKSPKRQEKKKRTRSEERSRSYSRELDGKIRKKKKNRHKDKTKNKIKENNDKGGPEIEIPSKAVFASGDKIVVSLHFGQNNSKSSSTAGTAVKKKRKKIDEMDEPKMPKEEPKENIDKMEGTSPVKKIEPVMSKKSETLMPAPSVKCEASNPVKEASANIGRATVNLRGRGGRLARPVRLRPRTKPVLIDIETSREIPIDGNNIDEVIVLSDSEDSQKGTDVPSSTMGCASIKTATEINKGKGKVVSQKHGVKFSLTTKAISLKKVNNPLFSMGGDEEESQEEEQDVKKIPVKEVVDKHKDEEKVSQLAAPEPLERIPSPVKISTSPIFRPVTPPISTYDPSQPTNTPSTSSTPSPSPSPSNSTPPLPPPPTPPSLPNLPLPHPGAVLIPPMTSLPPPPLPPPPLLTTPTFVVNPSLFTGVFHLTAAASSQFSPSLLPTTLLNPVGGGIGSLPPTIPISGTSLKPISSQGLPTQCTPTKVGRPMTPPSPTPSEGSDIFGPPSLSPPSPSCYQTQEVTSSKISPSKSRQQFHPKAKNQSDFDALLGSRSSSASVLPHQRSHGIKTSMKIQAYNKATNSISTAGDVMEEVPSSAVELQVKEKFLKKLNRQERVVEEVRLALKPYYTSKKISKNDYKEILRKCVPKICHTKSGEINPIKIKEMVKGYVKKFRYLHKKEAAH